MIKNNNDKWLQSSRQRSMMVGKRVSTSLAMLKQNSQLPQLQGVDEQFAGIGALAV
jgi:hypothetical protein